MLRVFLVLAVVGALFAGTWGAAAGLNVQGGTIQAGVDGTLYCDTNGVQVAGWGLETDTGKVHFVRIGGIDNACFGNALFVKVLNGVGTVLAGGSIDPINANQVTINFATPVDAAAIETLKVWIEGPNP